MNAFSDIFAYTAGIPAVVGLVLTAAIIFLTSDWRLSLTALLVQYILIGLALSTAVRLEVALVKILVGVLAVSILYLTARRIQEASGAPQIERGSPRFLGMSVGWEAGPLGLPLRLLAVLLAALAVLRVFNSFHLPLVSAGTALAAIWLIAMGAIGLVLSGDSLRVAAALLTILGGFDLVYARLEPSLAVVGFWSVLILSTALAFAYLAIARSLGGQPTNRLAFPPAPLEQPLYAEGREEAAGIGDSELEV